MGVVGYRHTQARVLVECGRSKSLIPAISSPSMLTTAVRSSDLNRASRAAGSNPIHASLKGDSDLLNRSQRDRSGRLSMALRLSRTISASCRLPGNLPRRLFSSAPSLAVSLFHSAWRATRYMRALVNETVDRSTTSFRSFGESLISIPGAERILTVARRQTQTERTRVNRGPKIWISRPS